MDTEAQGFPSQVVTPQDQSISNHKTLEEKASAILTVLKEDIRAADLKLSLFAAASKNFRHDTCLKPFPPHFIKNGERDIENVRSTLSGDVNLVKLLSFLEEQSFVSTNIDLVELLFFVLCSLKEPRLRMVPTNYHASILKKVLSEECASRPQYIVQVISDTSSSLESKWKTLSDNKRTSYAYHGSRLENFHSILHHGLQQHMSKKVVFGSGIYLSSELSVSLPYSPGGTGWTQSGFGTELSCVALCEIIESHEGVYCQNNTFAENQDIPDVSRSKLNDSMAGEVPNKYFVVSNNDLVRVRYLLVYTKDNPNFRKTTNNIEQQNGSMLRSWFSTHRLLFGYTVMLALIGLATNNNIQYYFKIFIKMLDKAMKVVEM